MDIGSKIDALYTARSIRLKLEKEIEALKKQEAEAKQEILTLLQDASLQGAKGAVATATVTHKVKPTVTDWDQVYAFIKEKDMLPLLHKRLTEGLWDSLREDGITVPGTESMVLTDLSLTKVGAAR